MPPLPERGDDAHVAHVNELFRAVAAANAGHRDVRRGPDAWCTDEAVATDRRHAVGRRARLQARRQADLRHDRPGPAGDLTATVSGRCAAGVARAPWPPRSLAPAKFTVPGMTTGDGTEVAADPPGPAQRPQRPRTSRSSTSTGTSSVRTSSPSTRCSTRRSRRCGRWPTPRPSASPPSACRRSGTPGALVAARTWDDYDIGRAGAIEHLGALERRLRRRHREPPQGDRRHRGARPGDPGPADRPVRRSSSCSTGSCGPTSRAPAASCRRPAPRTRRRRPRRPAPRATPHALTPIWPRSWPRSSDPGMPRIASPCRRLVTRSVDSEVTRW